MLGTYGNKPNTCIALNNIFDNTLIDSNLNWVSRIIYNSGVYNQTMLNQLVLEANFTRVMNLKHGLWFQYQNNNHFKKEYFDGPYPIAFQNIVKLYDIQISDYTKQTVETLSKICSLLTEKEIDALSNIGSNFIGKTMFRSGRIFKGIEYDPASQQNIETSVFNNKIYTNMSPLVIDHGNINNPYILKDFILWAGNEYQRSGVSNTITSIEPAIHPFF